ncbi:MarC family protein [archaeon]|jgi:multiple antibiotic resistance protein|nr:MarC family protein [archaeon]MBT3577292.1 MarC family protein [archaeon]MBT6820464.1 MarC family protein [archaeon]MBT7025278.1 MarC family protein [archaeon]MBT7238873.1 MarC family protein [archaeon]
MISIIAIVMEALFFLALINPVSKVVVVNMLPKKIQKNGIVRLIMKSNLIALAMLILFAFAGKFILQDFFQIDINALRIAGGIVLTVMGFRALDRGLFFNLDDDGSISEMAIVPLASPMIAGPATIAATILKASILSPLYVSFALIIAIGINALISLFSLNIKRALDRYNLMGAIIRITGLFVMSMGIHMIISAVKTYFGF